MLLTRFSCLFYCFWTNYFLCTLSAFAASQFNLVILSQFSAACSKSWYFKLEFSVTSFWFCYHRLWWSSWHTIVVLFLWYVFLIWILSTYDLFEVIETDASCVLCIICFQFILLIKSRFILFDCTWFVALLASFMPFCFPHAFAFFWLSL